MKVTTRITVTDVDKDLLILFTDEQVAQLGIKEGDSVTVTMTKIGQQETL